MIKESCYILRRILIGVGIVLVLGMLNGCKVKALTLFNEKEVPDVPSVITDNDYPFYINGYGGPTRLRLVYTTDTNLKVNSTSYPNDNTYFFISSSNYKVYECSSPCTSSSSWVYKGTTAQDYGVHIWRDSYMINQIINNPTISPSAQLYFNKNILFSNNDIANDLSLYSAYLPSQLPDFISFNAIPITTNNIITSYTVQPEFSSFDTDNYVYQYSFDNNRWLSLTENEQILRINNNSTIYVRVKDKNTDEYIDSATFTISNIGSFYDNQTYGINFSGEYRTSNYINKVNSSTSSVILEYQIYVDYIPKSSLLTYQYQYVVSGNNLDNNNWENVSSSDNGSITYVASQNGTLYARILDNENNVLKTGTFNVNSIGKLAIDNDSSGVGGLFSDISNKINFAGPLSSIINIPIYLATTISTGLAGGLTCNDYSLGSLWGTNLVIPCVNVKQHIGNSLYTTIDLIIACVMIYHIIKMFGELYTNLLFMHKNPIQDLGKRGD